MDCNYIKYLSNCCAFAPYYEKNKGKGTKIYFKNGGTIYIKYSISKVLGDYCAINRRSVAQLRGISEKLLLKKTLNPIYVDNSAMLIPVKTIKPMIVGDKCFGYINTRYIKDLNIKNKSIELQSGEIISYLERSVTLKTRIADGTILNQKILKVNSN